MAFITIKSSNEKFSYVLGKNPETGMITRSLRQGTVFGWYPSENAYSLYFRDGDDEISFKENPDQQFEYLSTQKYLSPAVYLGMIGKLLTQPMKEQSEYDNQNDVKSIQFNIKLGRKVYVEFFQKQFKDILIHTTEISNNCYTVTIHGEVSIYRLLHITTLFLVMNAVVTRDIDMSLNRVDQDQLVKYIKSLNAVDASYFIRYLIKKNLVKSEKIFRKFKEELEGGICELFFGGNDDARIRLVELELSEEYPVLDVGCGEGRYAFKFCKKVPDWYCVDIDEDLINTIERKMTHRKIENIHPNTELDDVEIDGPVDVIMVEVVEHMPLDEAKDLVSRVLLDYDVNKLILTTPNKEFNKYYGMEEDDMRHDDHDFELVEKEFIGFIQDVLNQSEMGNYFDVNFYGVGDRVDEQSSQHCVILQRKMQ